MNKIAATISAILINLSLGVSFSWSFTMRSIQHLTGWSQLQLVAATSACFLAFGISFYLFHQYAKKVKEINACITVFILMALSAPVSAFAIANSVWSLLMVADMLLIGVATGIGHYLSVKTIFTWYKDITMNFLIAALMVSYAVSGVIVTFLYDIAITGNLSVFEMFLIPSLIMILPIIPSIFFLRFNPERDKDENLHNLLKRTNFKAIIILYTAVSIIGLSILTNIVTIVFQMFQTYSFLGTSLVIIMGLTSIISRILWPLLSSIIERSLTMLVLAAFQILGLLGLIWAENYTSFLINACVVTSCYAGMLTMAPMHINDQFGRTYFLSTYRYFPLVWGICGFFVPLYETTFYTVTNNNDSALLLLCLISIICVISSLKLIERNISNQ